MTENSHPSGPVVSALINSGPPKDPAPANAVPSTATTVEGQTASSLTPSAGAVEALSRSGHQRFLGSSTSPEVVDATAVKESSTLLVAGSADADDSRSSVSNDPALNGDDAGGTDSPDDSEISSARNALEWVFVLVAAVAVALVLRTFVFQAFYIPSESMENTLLQNDRILINKTSYRLHELNRGDVVVFRRPDDQPGQIRDLVKRVIGLEGETIEAVDSTIYIDGTALDEPYLADGGFGDFGPIEIGTGEMFVMGDNRDESYDSRRFGPVDVDRVIGRAFVKFWPINRVGSL